METIRHIFIDDNEADADWIRAARLKKKADAGNKQAAAQLKKMFDTKLVSDLEYKHIIARGKQIDMVEGEITPVYEKGEEK